MRKGWSANRIQAYEMERGYQLHVDKHIHHVKLNKLEGFTCINAACTRQTSQNDTPYEVWLLVLANGDIHTAGCQCIGNEILDDLTNELQHAKNPVLWDALPGGSQVPSLLLSIPDLASLFQSECIQDVHLLTDPLQFAYCENRSVQDAALTLVHGVS
ncbi:hypothetical protein Pmani_012496 [Petrolisthes manimaculis]|uniref:Uncharacterized protein n=1 Tax=Petrolisthes manimaculis TaxID=1843537 RepID=A0AAE1UAG9_9EUCA|nr:hypothetical protein Pmani_012496 [Petrolisthes manimaculis]